MIENEKKVPKRRFKEFENADAWEQRELGNIADVTKLAGFEFTEHVIYSEEGNIIALRGLNVKNGQLILDDVKYIDRSNFAKLGRSKLYIDDILFTYVGTVGEVAIIKENDKFYLAPNVSRIRIKSEDLPQYISHYMRNNNFYNLVIFPLVATSSQPALSMENIRKFVIHLPKEKEEQAKISEYFSNLDNLITLHQRKLDKIKALKKSYLTEMFPKEGECKPKLRFAGFTDDWEQRKWIETVDISTEMVSPRCGDYDDLPHVAPGNIESFTGQLYDNVKTVKEENLISGKFHFREGDVIYGKINPQLGKYVFATFEGLTSADAYVLNAKNNLNQKFLFTLLQTNDFFNYSVSVSKRSGMPKINRSELNAYSFFSPSIDEQEKIGGMFLKIDNLITLHQRKLEKLQNIKKAYLNEMFI